MILDTRGNIFGGFTPVEWESREWNGKGGKQDNTHKGDPSLKSFLFTLKNPHNVPARRFGLKMEEQHRAITCDSTWGPHFADIGIHSNCDTSATNSTYHFGSTYTNDTGLDGKTFFAASWTFQVSEIEVFEITI
jgi:hypothetical protein